MNNIPLKKPLILDVDDAQLEKTDEKKPTKKRAKRSRKAPKVIYEEMVELTPSTAEHPPELSRKGQPETSMQKATQFMGRRSSKLVRLFWWALSSLVGLLVSVWFYEAVTNLIVKYKYVGMFAVILGVIIIIVLLFFALRELAAYSRLRRIDHLKNEATKIKENKDKKGALRFVAHLTRLYSGREDMRWATKNTEEKLVDVDDADTILLVAEREMMTGLDERATAEIETSTRQVAFATAIVPLALADIVIALTGNLRMIRRIAEIYGGRSGSFGSWRLLRTVAVHLLATGGVSVADDMLGAIAGGGILGRLSRRFGEGMINGALTARVGVAAMEVCRPMKFDALKPPSVTKTVAKAIGKWSKESVEVEIE